MVEVGGVKKSLKEFGGVSESSESSEEFRRVWISLKEFGEV